MRRIVVLACFALVAAGGSAPALAQSEVNCADRDQIITRLADLYGETRQMIGLVGGLQAIELFASQDTGTWTLLVTDVWGVSCVVALGDAFENVNELPEAEGIDG